MSPETDRENGAILALIAGSLHRFGGQVLSDEIETFLASGRALSREGAEALERLGDFPLETIEGSGRVPHASANQSSERLAAMHREASDAGLSADTQEQLEEARRKVLERLRNSKPSSPPE